MGVDYDESSEPTGVRSSVTISLVATTPVAVPCGQAAPAGGQGTAKGISLRDSAMKESPGHISAGIPWGFTMSTPLTTPAGVNASGGTVSPVVTVESSPTVSGGDEADYSPAPELRGRAAREQRMTRGNSRRPAGAESRREKAA